MNIFCVVAHLTILDYKLLSIDLSRQFSYCFTRYIDDTVVFRVQSSSFLPILRESLQSEVWSDLINK